MLIQTHANQLNTWRHAKLWVRRLLPAYIFRISSISTWRDVKSVHAVSMCLEDTMNDLLVLVVSWRTTKKNSHLEIALAPCILWGALWTLGVTVVPGQGMAIDTTRWSYLRVVTFLTKHLHPAYRIKSLYNTGKRIVQHARASTATVLASPSYFLLSVRCFVLEGDGLESDPEFTPSGWSASDSPFSSEEGDDEEPPLSSPFSLWSGGGFGRRLKWSAQISLHIICAIQMNNQGWGEPTDKTSLPRIQGGTSTALSTQQFAGVKWVVDIGNKETCPSFRDILFIGNENTKKKIPINDAQSGLALLLASSPSPPSSSLSLPFFLLRSDLMVRFRIAWGPTSSPSVTSFL